MPAILPNYDPVMRLEQTYAAIVKKKGYVPSRRGNPSNASRSLPKWSAEDCVMVLRLWVQAYGKLPTLRDYGEENYLPYKLRVRKVFGSHSAWVRHAVDLLPTSMRQDMVPCLVCDKPWISPDRRQRRICETCTSLDHMRQNDSGEWMNGTVITNETIVDDLQLEGFPS